MSETVRSFERGLRVLRCFGAGASELTLSEVARLTDLNRATARRLLLTLEEQGYVRRSGDRFSLTPRVLDLGYAYLSSFALPELALPSIEALSTEVREASSLGVLDATDVVYVARVPAKRVMTVSIGLGTRFPAYRTSLGRAILCGASDDEVAAVWAASDRAEPTPKTVTSLAAFQATIEEARAKGYAMVDQELELGVRSVAAPVRDAAGAIVAAINVSTHVSRTSKSELVRTVVPPLRRAVADVERAVATRPGLRVTGVEDRAVHLGRS
ncbi:MAG: helix-turn-helix domain-containing protein [Nitriliruptoraceae bacterium]|nr:helix-turn-helix domain-containing protein [Nitriliruptoraceae bacterium]